MRGGCGSDVVLETVNATRAFLTIDSGFPLAELEQALRTNRPFTYDYQPTQVPVLYGPEYWLSAQGEDSGRVHRPVPRRSVAVPPLPGPVEARSGNRRRTAQGACPSAASGPSRTCSISSAACSEIRNGKAVVPGGAAPRAAWADLVGRHPRPGRRVLRKAGRQGRRLAGQLLRCAAAHRRPGAGLPDRAGAHEALLHGPARPGHQPRPGAPRLPLQHRHDAADHAAARGRRRQAAHSRAASKSGRSLFINHPHGKYDGKLTKAADGWKDPDDVLEALFGLSPQGGGERAAQDLHGAQRPGSPSGASRSSRRRSTGWRATYRYYGAQYRASQRSARALATRPSSQFLDTADGHQRRSATTALRADAAGTLQALVGAVADLRAGRADSAERGRRDAGAASSTPFADVKNARDLFDAGRGGVKLLLKATGAPPDAQSAGPDARPAGRRRRARRTTNRTSCWSQEMMRDLRGAEAGLAEDALRPGRPPGSAVAKGEKLNTRWSTGWRRASRRSSCRAPR